MVREMKFREIGVFKSKPKAEAWATTLRAKGKRIRIEKQILPVYGGAAITGTAYSVKEWRGTEVLGRRYRIDTKVE